MYPSSLGWWMVTKSGRGVVGQCWPLGSQSSMISTLIPSTSWKQCIKGIRNIYEDQSNGLTLSGFFTLHRLPILMNDWANLSKKHMTQSRVNLSIYSITGCPEEIMYPSLTFIDLARWALSLPLAITADQKEEIVFCMLSWSSEKNSFCSHLTSFCSTLHDKSKNTKACPNKTGGRMDD